MSLERFYSDTPLGEVGENVKLSGTEAQHMLRVMRKTVDDEVTLFDGQGGEVRAIVVACDRRCAELQIREKAERKPRSAPILELAVALPRGGEALNVVRRAIEAGADPIRPLIATRSVHRSDTKRLEKREQKFLQAAIAAMKQCGNNWMPTFLAPTKLTNLTLSEGQIGVFGTTQVGTTLRQFERKHGGVPAHILVVIGPEGGLTSEEELYLQDEGFFGLSLGHHVYRVETAVIGFLTYFSSADQSELT